MPRPIDHLVLAVPDLGAAMTLYGALGFTVGSRNRHPWGTENAVIQLDGAFLELIGLGDGFVPPDPGEPAAPFARPVAAAVARGGGLAFIALGSGDADADARRLMAAGWGEGRRLDFGRSAEAPDGTRRDVNFSLAFTHDPALPEAGFFTCHHHRPEYFWNPAAQRHANGATRLDAVVLAVDDPATPLDLLAAVCDALPDGTGVETATGCIAVMRPADAVARTGEGAVAGRFAGFGVVAEGLGALRQRLDAAAVPHRDIGGAVVVRAFGVALAFAPPPCHSGA